VDVKMVAVAGIPAIEFVKVVLFSLEVVLEFRCRERTVWDELDSCDAYCDEVWDVMVEELGVWVGDDEGCEELVVWVANVEELEVWIEEVETLEVWIEEVETLEELEAWIEEVETLEVCVASDRCVVSYWGSGSMLLVWVATVKEIVGWKELVACAEDVGIRLVVVCKVLDGRSLPMDVLRLVVEKFVVVAVRDVDDEMFAAVGFEKFSAAVARNVIDEMFIAVFEMFTAKVFRDVVAETFLASFVMFTAVAVRDTVVEAFTVVVEMFTTAAIVVLALCVVLVLVVVFEDDVGTPTCVTASIDAPCA